MIKYLISVFIVIFSLQTVSCQTLKGCRYPKEYFEKYNVIRKIDIESSPINFNGAYIYEFHYKDEKFITYSFYYINNLVTSITIPININGHFISTEKELFDAIKNGFLDDYLTYSYFEIIENKIYGYGIDEWKGGITIGKHTFSIVQSINSIIDDKSIMLSNNFSVKNFYLGFSWKETKVNSDKTDFIARFKEMNVKPNQLKSKFLLRYNCYIETGNLKFTQ